MDQSSNLDEWEKQIEPDSASGKLDYLLGIDGRYRGGTCEAAA